MKQASNDTIKIPDLGGAEDVEVVEISVAEGDSIAVDDIMLVLESDKASMEIPSPAGGVLERIEVAVGDKVAEGDVFARLVADKNRTGPSDAEADSTSEVVSSSSAPSGSDATDDSAAAADQGEPSASTTVIDVPVPDVGGAEKLEVIELLVRPGDELDQGATLLVLESDKASMEVPAPMAGRVVAVLPELGDQISEGDVILRLETTAQQTSSSSTEQKVKHVEPTESPTLKTPDDVVARNSQSVERPEQPPVESSAAVHAGPAVRKLAREFGVDLNRVAGSGPLGRILKEDVQAYVKDGLANKPLGAVAAIEPLEDIDFAQFGPVRVEPLSSLQKLTASNLHRSWLTVPRVSHSDEVDITELEAFRKDLKAELAEKGVKLTPLPFLLKACAYALRQNPQCNASLSGGGEHLVYKDYVHIGMAVATPAGLLVPVVRDVDNKSLLELAVETAELAELAKARKLKLDQMQGACFTVSSLGNRGGTGFTPIINAPELAILGVSRLAVKPVWNGKKFKPRQMLPLTLAYDHRAINGADAGQFMLDIAGALADIRRLLL